MFYLGSGYVVLLSMIVSFSFNGVLMRDLSRGFQILTPDLMSHLNGKPTWGNEWLSMKLWKEKCPI